MVTCVKLTENPIHKLGQSNAGSKQLSTSKVQSVFYSPLRKKWSDVHNTINPAITLPSTTSWFPKPCYSTSATTKATTHDNEQLNIECGQVILQILWVSEDSSMPQEMRPLTTRQQQRIDKKKKKMAAYLEIAKLNDQDIEAKQNAGSSNSEGEGSELCPQEPSRKKQRTTEYQVWSEKYTPGANHIPVIPKNSVSHLSNCQLGLSSDKPTLHSDSEHKDGSFPRIEQMESNSKHQTNWQETNKMPDNDYIKLKQEVRNRKNKFNQVPHFRLKSVGDKASVQLNEAQRCPLFLNDVQHLLMFALLGHQSPYVPRWCHMEKYNRLSHTIVLIVEGISLYEYLAYESLFPAITSLLTHRIEVVVPAQYNSSLVRELALVPSTSLHKKQLISDYGNLEAALKNNEEVFRALRAVFPVAQVREDGKDKVLASIPESDKYPRTHLLLSAWQMIEEHYPLLLKGEMQSNSICNCALRYTEYVFTKSEYKEVTPNSPMFALDCEMCRTTTGELELTRASVVNEKLEVIYDILVKPDNHITDYLTRYSGITEIMLSEVTNKLSDVQKDLINLLPPDAILVGHSLNCDLHALQPVAQMMHPYVIDTSVIYNMAGDRSRKCKLALLCDRLLHESIQRSSKGHSPIEDSQAAMKLTQMKLANTVEFGDAVLMGRTKAEKTLIRTLEKEQAANISNQASKEKTAIVIASESVIREYKLHLGNKEPASTCNVKCVVADSNSDVVTQTCQVALEHHMTISHLRVDVSGTLPPDDQLRQVDDWCGKVWEHLAFNGLCVVLFASRPGSVNGACFVQVKKLAKSSKRLG
uniref:Exonuclease domain-containing protein n=1 Tax=Timema cristinae TaxID=61476 RepID=A0A7R9CGH0_TIMCR|nr:unnamed protein product [Timema cristinae]